MRKLSLVLIGLVVAACHSKQQKPQFGSGPLGTPPQNVSGKYPFVVGPTGTRFYERGGHKVLVFVHGVMGSAAGTWRNDSTGAYWPEMALADTAFHDFDVYVVGYDTPPLATALNLEQLSANLEVQLRADGVFKYREVYIIAHSMGGLVTKRILTDLAIADSPERSRVRGVFLIATPNRGAQIVELAKFLHSRNPQFGDMSAEGIRYLQAVDNFWTTMMNARTSRVPWPRAYCAYEIKPTILGIQIVSEVSAETRCDNSPLPLQYDHLGVVKPAAINVLPYSWARYQIVALANDDSGFVKGFAPESLSERRSATMFQQITVGHDTIVVDGVLDTTLTTGNHDCTHDCRGEPTRTFYQMILHAPVDHILEEPKLECIGGPCAFSSIVGLFPQSSASLIARFDVWSKPTTWRLSAKYAHTKELVSTETLASQQLAPGQTFTIVLPPSAKSIRLNFENSAGVLTVDPTNLTGGGVVELVASTIDPEGRRTYSLRFRGL